MLNTIVIILTVFSAIAGLIVAAWSYIDTQRVLSHRKFLVEREEEHHQARNRFKERTRLGKKDD
ncbi:hypothetical protein Q6U54_000721 [Vibrio vulnificus]|nr:hypothetical protein [Vibrio cidicii]ELL0595143.1 hypothetical protein [Vibrio vulnificus]HDY7815735.1 hypothetical protein [Vibrio vulnificus]